MATRPIIQRVIYVDAVGKAHDARTLERARTDEHIRLVTKIGPTITVVRARYSPSLEGGTWHFPASPN